MESFIVDAVAFLAFLADQLPKKADDVFKKAEEKQTKLLLPSIALGETLYTIYKGKDIFGKKVPLEKVELIFLILEKGDFMNLVELDVRAWRIFNELKILELHDRMIVTSFIYHKATAILTNDDEIADAAPIIWD